MNYNLHVNKRWLQAQLFSTVTSKEVVCLGGPNVTNYVSLYPKEIKKFISYEKDNKVFDRQRVTLSDPRVTIINDDVANCSISGDRFYDLDFCNTVKLNQSTIKKFKDQKFMLTVCPRLPNSQEVLFNTLGEKVQKIEDTEDRIFVKITTDKNQYLHTNYHDSSTMSIYFKL